MSAKGSELKRVRQTKKANTRNKYFKSKINTNIKKFMSLDKKTAMESYPDIVKLIDQVKSKGIIHKNKANNKKSKLSRHLTQMK